MLLLLLAVPRGGKKYGKPKSNAASIESGASSTFDSAAREFQWVSEKHMEVAKRMTAITREVLNVVSEILLEEARRSSQTSLFGESTRKEESEISEKVREDT